MEMLSESTAAITAIVVTLGLFSLAYLIGCLALGGWLASEKGYSVGSWIVLLLFFNVIALVVLVGAPDKKGRVKYGGSNPGEKVIT